MHPCAPKKRRGLECSRRPNELESIDNQGDATRSLEVLSDARKKARRERFFGKRERLRRSVALPGRLRKGDSPAGPGVSKNLEVVKKSQTGWDKPKNVPNAYYRGFFWQEPHYMVVFSFTFYPDCGFFALQNVFEESYGFGF